MSTGPEVLTLTLNPAIDETVFLDTLVPGAVNRALGHHRQAGGKGINVSSMLSQYGIPSTATGLLGRVNPGLFEMLFKERGITDECLRISGETRTGIKIVAESSGQTTDINFPGAEPTRDNLVELKRRIAGLCRPGAWMVAAGSLPTGVLPGDFSGLIDAARQAGAMVAVDTSGAALRAAVDRGVDLVKPNHHELAELFGHELPDSKSRIAAAIELQRSGIAHVIVSLGGDGAIFASPDGVLASSPPPVRVASTVGAGDSLLAGYLAGLVRGMGLAERAQLASVFAWCAIESVGRVLCPPGEIAARMRRIQVDPIYRR
jgi:1-phosphofructokinase family hexose kinase